MHDYISYSNLFVSINEIIGYLNELNAPTNYIQTLQQTQQAIVALELLNLSTDPTHIT